MLRASLTSISGRFLPGLVVAATIGAATGTVGCTPSPADAPDGAAVVIEVVDGDTVDVRIGGRTERVRLIGLDTPETKRPDTPVECFGPEATAFTASLLAEGTVVRIERDVVGRDHFGRLLGYVHLADGTFVNHEIIRRGFATPMSIEPNSVHARAFADAARAAEAEHLGLWAACGS